MLLTESQILVLDLLMRGRTLGRGSLNRQELLNNEAFPIDARIKLAWAALTIPDALVKWIGQHDFSLTPAGVAYCEEHFESWRKPAL